MVQQRSIGLGLGRGSLIEFSDGSVAYRPTGSLFPAFRVRIDDVNGFSTRHATRADRRYLKANNLQQVLSLYGFGGLLAEVPVNYGTAEIIQAWFQSKQGRAENSSPDWNPNEALGDGGSIADEIGKLKKLKEQGAITEKEFGKQKKRLLKRK